MGISDVFNVKKIKEENEYLKSLMTPAMQNALSMQQHITQLQSQINDLQTQQNNMNKQLQKSEQQLKNSNTQIEDAKRRLIILNDDIFVQDFGLYQPRYNFMTSEEYKERLEFERLSQKEMIKRGFAVAGNTNWTINGSKSDGNKMVRDMQKLLLRAFNCECENVIDKVKYNNFEASKKRITASCNAISKLGSMMGIYITEMYYDSKIDELHLAHEYNVKKQEEKEAQKEARARMREEAKLQKELEIQRKKVEKEQLHYQNALIAIMKQIQEAGETKDLLDKKQELEEQLGEIHHTLADLDYREANQRAGYVYIISNIGAFGENIYKIGMTRRLDPQERVDELGDASVPFNFDVHAMIFSEDAPALENALHKAFEKRKVNLVNKRREFFYASLDEIKEVIRSNYDKTVEFIEIPDAEQYRTSIKMRQQGIYN